MRPYTSDDVRFMTKGKSLYAFVMAWPDSRTTVIKSLAKGSEPLASRKIVHVSLLGYGGKLEWTQDDKGLNVKLPDTAPSKYAIALKIDGSIA